jgi:UPF0755 protein
MTIRSGGSPRGGRPPVHSYDPDAYATETIPPFSRPVDNGSRNGRGGGRGGGIMGVVKFLAFALVLGGVVLVVALTALRPLVNNAILSWAADNPGALQIGFVRDLVREDLGASLTRPGGSDDDQLEFVVEPGDTATSIAQRLQREGFLVDSRAFVFIAIDRELTGALQSGTFILRQTMTPDQLVTALLAPPAVPYVDIALRTGLRLEQVTAKLQTLPLEMDVREFYETAKHPPASLVADYPWLARILRDAPDGASLEGFLWPATYRVLPDTQPEELIRLMLDRFIDKVGDERLVVAEDRGLNFYQVLTLASIVEREAVLDEERPVIAGVYQNRIVGLNGVAPILNADPTVFFAIDTVELDKLPFNDWQRYVFWKPPGVPLGDVVVPEELQGYQTYQVAGLIPGPICTPTVASIDAALEPDTTEEYLYFLAIPDGGGAHAFAKTNKEHNENRRKYGYIQ